MGGSSALSSSWEDCLCCDLCGAKGQQVLFAIRPLSDGRPGGIVRCMECGLVYRSVRPKMGVDRCAYEHKDYSNPAPGWIAGRKAVFAAQIKALEPYRCYNRVLDIGAGHGFFLSACADRGWDGQGIELASQAVDFARQHLGLDMVQASLEEADLPAAQYDAVTLWNVLDQIRSPHQTVRQIHRLLRPGGVVVIRLPNAAFHVPARRLFERLGRPSPTVFHLYSFDLLRLRLLLEKVGFIQIKGAVSRLSWTTGHDVRPSMGKRLVSRGVEGAAQVVWGVSAGRVLWAPSMVVTACKSEDGRSGVNQS